MKATRFTKTCHLRRDEKMLRTRYKCNLFQKPSTVIKWLNLTLVSLIQDLVAFFFLKKQPVSCLLKVKKLENSMNHKE